MTSKQQAERTLRFITISFLAELRLRSYNPKPGAKVISGILLAAGESRRMGEFKQLLTYAGKTFVEHCADSLLRARLGEVIIVTGHRNADVRRAIGDRPVRFINNPDYHSGMASSVKAGVRAVSENSRACVIALVDQPRIDANLINELIQTYERLKPLIVIPRFKGRNGHPLLIDLKLREEILKMDIQEGLRMVVHSHSEQTAHIEVVTQAVVEDFDLPDDYERLLRR